MKNRVEFSELNSFLASLSCLIQNDFSTKYTLKINNSMNRTLLSKMPLTTYTQLTLFPNAREQLESAKDIDRKAKTNKQNKTK